MNKSASKTKKDSSEIRNCLFWRRRRDSLRYPSPKNSPPDCFSIKIKIFMAAQSTPSSPIKIKNDPVFTGSFFGGEGGTRTLAPVLGRPTPLAGAPRHQLEYFSRLVSAMLFISFSQKVEIFPDPLAAKEILWRRGWDSNPRLLRVTSFQD